MNPHPTPSRAGFVAALCLGQALLMPSAQAQSDNFNDGNDTGWTRYTPLAPFGAGGTHAIVDGSYRLTAPASPNPDFLGPARIGSLFPNANFNRAQVEVDIFGWNTALTQSVGVFARASDLGLGTTTGYTYNYNVVSGFHQINMVLNEAASRVVNESLYPLNPDHRYRMVFTATGNQFLGRLYSATNSTVPIRSLFGTDDTHASGRSGVFVFAINVTHGLDTRFDNYVASTPAQVRSTFMDATPAVGEIPTEPVASIVVRLAQVETTLQTDSIRLTIDGQAVTTEVTEFDSVVTVGHTPTTPLDPTKPHQATLRVSDELGEQTFTWEFGTPAAVTPMLFAATNLQEAFQPEANAVLDATSKRFTAPVVGNQRFYRIQDAAQRTLKSVTLVGNNVQIAFE
jgi:hypothetical protein